MSQLHSVEHRVDDGAGWELALVQTWDEEAPPPPGGPRPPVVIVPGYGMNSFIFSFHPRGLSLEGYLATRGLEVWRVDLRGQGGSRPSRGPIAASDDYRLEDLALVDLEAAISAIVEKNRSGSNRVSVIGASLGGTLMFITAVLGRRERLASLVAIGSPVRWVRIHPVLRLAFSSPRLVGMLRFKGTRKLAEAALPLLARHTPWILSIYMNAGITEMSAAREMVKTVEDPNRFINRQIAEWIAAKDLLLHGVNVSEALGALDLPVLCVLANADGIVPRETAAFPYERVRSTRKGLLEVGEAELAMAHADLFVSNEAHERVFRPVADWLIETS